VNVLVLYESRRGYTLTVARAIRDEVRLRGHASSAASLGAVDAGTVAAADALVVGSWVAGKIVAGVGPPRDALEAIGALGPLDGMPAAVFCTYDVAPRGTLDVLAQALEAIGARVRVGERFRGGPGRTRRASLAKVPGLVDAALASFTPDAGAV
jgi:hypothetical protein